MGAVDLVDLGNDTIIIASGRQDQVLGAALWSGIVVPFGCQSRTQVIEDEVTVATGLVRRAIIWRVLLLL